MLFNLFVTIFTCDFSLMYPDILNSSFFGVLFPVIQLFCDLFFLFFTWNVSRNLHFFIYRGISLFRKNFMLCFVVLFCQFRTPIFSTFAILGYMTTTIVIFKVVCGVFASFLYYMLLFRCIFICKNHNISLYSYMLWLKLIIFIYYVILFLENSLPNTTTFPYFRTCCGLSFPYSILVWYSPSKFSFQIPQHSNITKIVVVDLHFPSKKASHTFQCEKLSLNLTSILPRHNTS